MSSSGHLYEVESAIGAIARIKGVKPVVSFVYGYALGGNYVLASETDHIVAQQTSTLGGLSIAVSSFDPKPLLGRIGVDIITKGYGDLKVMPEKGAKNYEAYVSHRNSIYESLYKWMLGRVQENRRLSPQSMDKIRKGEWYLGQRAKKYGLCDSTGDFISAVDVVKRKVAISDLKVIDYSHGAAPQQSNMAVLKKLFHVKEKSYHWLLRRMSMGLRALMIDSVDYAVRHSIVM
jgi:protease-4